MAELDQVVQQLLIKGRQATAAIAAVPTRVVGVLARLGLVALLQRAETATAAALPRAGGPEPCAAVRAGADQASSNGALLSQVQDNLASLRAIRRGVLLGLSRLMCGPAVAAARKSTMHSSRPRRRSRQPTHRKPPSLSIPASTQTGVMDHVASRRRFRGRTRPPLASPPRAQEHQSRASEQPCQTVVEPEQPGARISAQCCFR
jgi:hypothetical protein